MGSPERSEIFEYHCLKQLARDDDAAARLKEFEQNVAPPDRISDDPLGRNNGKAPQDFGLGDRLAVRLIHDLYIAEVFLSIDAWDAGIAFLRGQLKSDDDGLNRLSRAIVLSQMLLIAGRHEDYLAMCTEFVLPLGLAAWERVEEKDAARPGDRNQILRLFGGLCLAPLFRADFLAGIPAEAIRQNIGPWKALQSPEPDGDPALAVDLFLRAANLRLEDGAQARESDVRLARNPATKAAFGEKPVDEALQEMFAATGQVTSSP
jgi:hypothetical protein